jgi:uncharacterized protein (DUF2336 family)
MVEYATLLADLEHAMSRATAESCLRALWHTTDTLVAGSYSEGQIATFGEIIGRLAGEIEVDARVRLAAKLARSNNAPHAIVGKLAADDEIDVARPVLRHSERLDVAALVACASSKGQPHLLAISERRRIPEAVTDILVVRGSREVVTAVAANGGAQFSVTGFQILVRRAEGDAILAERVGLRHDIPAHLFHQLIAKASAQVKEKLARERPDMESDVLRTVSDVAGAIRARFGPAAKDHFAARRTVAKLHESGRLTEDKVFEIAYSLKFNETAVAMSLLCSVPIDIVERSLVDSNREPVLILAKALGFSWGTTMALLFLGAPNYRITAGDLDRVKVDFVRLKLDTCLRVLAVYRSRKLPTAQESTSLSTSLPGQYPN